MKKIKILHSFMFFMLFIMSNQSIMQQNGHEMSQFMHGKENTSSQKNLVGNQNSEKVSIGESVHAEPNTEQNQVLLPSSQSVSIGESVHAESTMEQNQVLLPSSQSVSIGESVHAESTMEQNQVFPQSSQSVSIGESVHAEPNTEQQNQVLLPRSQKYVNIGEPVSSTLENQRQFLSLNQEDLVSVRQSISLYPQGSSYIENATPTIQDIGQPLSMTTRSQQASSRFPSSQINLNPIFQKWPVPPPSVAENVDLQKYIGRWYQQAWIPAIFQAGCQDVTADYTLNEDGSIKVNNTCFRFGQYRSQFGRARVDDSVKPPTNSKLLVSFTDFPQEGQYWIARLGKQYEYSVVTNSEYAFMWILYRQPVMPDQLYQSLLCQLAIAGFPVYRLEKTQYIGDRDKV